MNIEYKLTSSITSNEFINILKNSTLGLRRPIDDIETIKGMIDNAIEYYPKIGFTQHQSAWTLSK